MIVEILLFVSAVILISAGITWPVYSKPFYKPTPRDHLMPVTLVWAGVTLVSTAAYMVIT